MAQNNVVLSQGTSVYRGILQKGSGIVLWNKINRVSAFSGPNATKEKIDVTPLHGEYTEYKYGPTDMGDIVFTIKFDSSDPIHRAIIETDIHSFENTPWKFILSDGTVFEFLGNVTGSPLSGSVDTVVEWSLTLTISGAPTWTWST